MHRLSHGERWRSLHSAPASACSTSHRSSGCAFPLPSRAAACGEDCTNDGIHYNEATFDASVREEPQGPAASLALPAAAWLGGGCPAPRLPHVGELAEMSHRGCCAPPRGRSSARPQVQQFAAAQWLVEVGRGWLPPAGVRAPASGSRRVRGFLAGERPRRRAGGTAGAADAGGGAAGRRGLRGAWEWGGGATRGGDATPQEGWRRREREEAPQEEAAAAAAVGLGAAGAGAGGAASGGEAAEELQS